MGSYIPSTKEERLEMLKAIGLEQFEQLYADVPEQALLKELKGVPEGKSEMEVLRKMSEMADKNRVFKTILRGAGAYDHYIPAIVDSVTGKEEFLTAYTPYQAELSQGVLQSIFEYQTMICELTGMSVSNASIYDGASAAAEAAMMCLKKNKNKVLVPSDVHPDVLETIKTYCWARDAEVIIVPCKNGTVDMAELTKLLGKDSACFYLQQPNFYGLLSDAEQIADAVHAAGAKMIMGVYPIALGLIKTPFECGADIAVGEGQPLGMPLSFGGPYLGFMATTQDMMRSLPGRIVGQTTDSNGQRAFVLTLQAREQHIRREKASSNVCSNQALCAMRAAVYMASMGPKGIKQAASLSYQKAHYLAEQLCSLPGFKLVHQGEFFNEFLTTTPVPSHAIERALMQNGILSGLPLDEGMLWCVTEKVSKETMDEVVRIVKGAYSV